MKYLLWIQNGYDYEDFEEDVIGVYSTRSKAREAQRQANIKIQKIIAKDRRALYVPFRSLTLHPLYYSLKITSMKEDRLP